jgi:hypothetical protein
LQFFDRRTALCALLIFSVKRTIEVASFTVKLLLPARGAPVLAQLGRATAAARNGYHAASNRWHSSKPHDIVYQFPWSHYPKIDVSSNYSTFCRVISLTYPIQSTTIKAGKKLSVARSSCASRQQEPAFLISLSDCT